jgi:hypothetical protein
MTDVDRIVRENDRLTKEVRDLRARLTAVESSRWWRLHPRFALRHLRARADNGTPAPAAEEAQRFPVDFDERDADLCRRVGPYTMTTPPRIYALVRAVEYVVQNSISGAFVECGVWRGGSMMAVALTLQRLNATDRELYLFDTFAGMTAPTDADVKPSGERAADLLASDDADSDVWAIAPLDDVREAVLGTGYPTERIRFVEGPVEDTLPDSAPAEIALLRLDTDWYASTKHELDHLYDRVPSGGVLIIDDYGHWRGARKATDEFVARTPGFGLLTRIDYTGRLAVKP